MNRSGSTEHNPHRCIITARIIERSAQIEALDGTMQIDKGELKTLAIFMNPRPDGMRRQSAAATALWIVNGPSKRKVQSLAGRTP